MMRKCGTQKFELRLERIWTRAKIEWQRSGHGTIPTPIECSNLW
jgi:hypothetical protein